jgi:pimeloyl-ACP methyl ester carboxylesterase
MTRMLAAGARYEVRDSRAGLPLLLIHGFAGLGSSWAVHLPPLRRTHRTIVVDLLGHGRSDAPADPARHASSSR